MAYRDVLGKYITGSLCQQYFIKNDQTQEMDWQCEWFIDTYAYVNFISTQLLVSEDLLVLGLQGISHSVQVLLESSLQVAGEVLAHAPGNLDGQAVRKQLEKKKKTRLCY